jgi:hypothetical protein
LKNCDRENLRIEHESTCKESESLRNLILNRPNPIDQENMIKDLEDQLQAKESIMQAHTNTLLTQISTLQEKLNLAIEQNKQLSVQMHTINKLKQIKRDLKQVINEQELKIEDLKNCSARQDRILTSLQIQLRDLSYDNEKMLKRFKNPLSWFRNPGK